jgi:hypothetical protein
VALGFKELDKGFAHLRRSHSRHIVSFLFYGTNLEKGERNGKSVQGEKSQKSPARGPGIGG